MDCLFCKIAQGQIPAKLVYEDAEMLAFHDIHPQAPTHLLLIPKRHIASINEIESGDEDLLGRLLLRAKLLAESHHLSQEGYRLVFNVNSGGGQQVYHIHLHLLGGRQMTWPPG